jgi:serine/threonine-protein kinase RsbT
MSDSRQVNIASEVDVILARQEGRALAVLAGFTGSDLTIIATAISEIARNIVEYAEKGTMVFEIVSNGTKKGIRVVAVDHGPGIPNIARAMQDGYSTSRGLGLGLPGSKRLMDEFEIESEVGSGTTVRMVKWTR